MIQSEIKLHEVLPDISEIWDPNKSTGSINEGHSGYKKINIPIESEEHGNMKDFEIGILPMRSCTFAHN